MQPLFFTVCMDEQTLRRHASTMSSSAVERRDSREANELRPLPSASSQQNPANEQAEHPRADKNVKPKTVRFEGIRKFWRLHVAVKVPHNDCRDHLALERTFLAFIRTALALAIMGVAIDQLFRLNHSTTPDEVFGFYVMGEPLAALFISGSLLVTVFASWRFWRQQNALTRGKVHVAGWELWAVGLVVASVCRPAFRFSVLTCQNSLYFWFLWSQ